MTAKMDKFKNTIDKGLYLLANLYDDLGSIVMTGVPLDPSQVYGMGKTENWKCIKKEFKPLILSQTNTKDDFANNRYDGNLILWNKNMVAYASTDGNNRCQVYLYGNSIRVQPYWSNKNIEDDNQNTIGTLHLENMGIDKDKGLPYGINFCGYNDGNGSVLFCDILATGVLRCVETVNNWKGYSGTNNLRSQTKATYIGHSTFDYPALPPEYMLDDFCQLWYWKRVS